MPVTGTTPLWVAARILLYGKVDDFFRLKEKVLQTFDPEDIHDLRVASRRLREGLELFAPCYGPSGIGRLIKKIKRVTRHLGEMRNRDEAYLFFSALAAELDDPCRAALEGLAESFAKKREKELKEFRAGLKRSIPPSLRDDCFRAINSPLLFAPAAAGADLFAPVSLFAKDAIAGRLAAVMELVPGARQAGMVEAQHLLRIGVKHFRYRLELLSFLIGAGFPEIHGALKRYQDLLGTMHDLDVFSGIVREAGFAADVEEQVQAAVAERRERLFEEFTGMLESVPFEELGNRARSGW